MTAFISHLERFDRVGSTNDVVRGWLDAGHAEVCLAVADEQTAGRGRSGRTWLAPRGAALLLSLGFRPTWLVPERAWQLGAIVSLAMADAATTIAGLAAATIRLKWPNDLVVEDDAAGVRKLGGVLGETRGLGTNDPQVVVGLGVNTGWPRDAFPPELAASMTSLHEISGGQPIETRDLLESFLVRLEPAIGRLRAGRFDAAGWATRQLTTGRLIRLERPNGSDTVRALGVDTETGALVIEDPAASDGARTVMVGEVGHLRVADPHPVQV